MPVYLPWRLRPLPLPLPLLLVQALPWAQRALQG
jgi:hypothetical protein